MMKKAVAAGLSFLMLALFLFAASAAGPALRLSAKKTAQEAEITVSADGFCLTSAQLILSYESEKLTFLSAERLTDDPDDELDVRTRASNEGELLINYAAVRTCNGAFVKIRFSINDGADGKTAFSLKIKSLFLAENKQGYLPKYSTVPCAGASLDFSGSSGQQGELFYPGDVDMDGKVTPADARIALRVSVKLDTISDDAYFLADVDGSGKVTSADARMILRAAVGLEKL